jgi:hypothetical protein
VATHQRWVGGGNVPSSMFGRVNATWPLAVLTHSSTNVQLRIRPRLFGAVRLDAAPNDVTRVFPVLSRFTEGVGIQDRSGDTWLFWCKVTPEILGACSDAGYSVTDEIEDVKKLVWKI